MRLTCPNCEAQYEVPEDVIPPEGRDVQCSSCGNTWFQASAATIDAPSAFEDFPEPAPTGAAKEPEPEDELPEDTAVEPEPQQVDAADADIDAVDADPDPDDDTNEPDSFADEEPVSDPQPEQPPRVVRERPKPRLDPAIAGILREEAAREAELRASNERGLESQTELGLEPPEQEETDKRARQSRDHMARMRGENPVEIEAAETGSRRGLLPDIEEINSTLRAGSDADTPTAAAADTDKRPRSSGFTYGFLLVLLGAAGLAAVYSKAPEIAQAVPQADPAVSSYVALVDQARVWLDAQVRSVMTNSPL